MLATINNLPNEVLLDIIQHLDYYDLKKCMRVNKVFNAIIIKHTTFDRVLFRSASVIGKDGIIIKDSTFAIHPALRHAPYVEKTRTERLKLSKPLVALHSAFSVDCSVKSVSGQSMMVVTTLAAAHMFVISYSLSLLYLQLNLPLLERVHFRL